MEQPNVLENTNEQIMSPEQKEKLLFYQRMNKLMADTARITAALVGLTIAFGAGKLEEKLERELDRTKEDMETLKKNVNEMKKEFPTHIYEGGFDNYYSEPTIPKIVPEQPSEIESEETIEAINNRA